MYVNQNDQLMYDCRYIPNLNVSSRFPLNLNGVLNAN
jgi:hypothetical protein